MKINLKTDQEIIEEAFQVLIEHLDTTKVMRFWTICNLGGGDYLKLKDKLFAGETVDSLYEKIEAEQESDDCD